MKDRNLKAQIYLNENTQNSLKNCQLSETKLLGDSYLIKCKFTQNDVDFIGENNNNESLFYDVLCGDKQSRRRLCAERRREPQWNAPERRTRGGTHGSSGRR